MSNKLQEHLNERLKEVKADIDETTIEEVALGLEKHDDFILIDIRENSEWEEGHLPKAVHLPRGILEFQIGTVTEDFEQPIILYCRGGNRSALSTDSLNKLGFKNVKSMQGGFREWHGAGYPVVKD